MQCYISSILKKLLVLVSVPTCLVLIPFQSAFCECQELGVYCGSPASETFPACCPFYTDANGKQTPLKCSKVDNGIGTCELLEESGNISSSSSGKN